MIVVERPTKAHNTVNILHLYRTESGVWCFDDKDLDIVGEPFVGTINDMIDMYVDGATRADVWISSSPLPDYTVKLNKIEKGLEGTYELDGFEIVGWLCPCTLQYFPSYPENIYAIIKPIKEGE